MMKSENVELTFTDEAIREIAKVAYTTNKSVENIGARRLHTVIERVMEEISFEAPDRAGQRFEVTADYVKNRVKDLLGNTDLRKLLKFEFPALAVFVNLFSWSGLYMLNRSLANSLEYSSVLIGSFLLLRFATYRDYYSFYSSLAAVVFSTYVRPTAVLFWAPILIQILWHFNGLFREVRFLMQIVAVSLCILLSCIIIDSTFYGEFTVAPWNFFVINVLEKKAAYFGVKPWHFAFTEGLPVVLALFFPLLFLISPANLLAMAKLTRILLLSALSYVVLLQATSSHQEHRFYLPVIPYFHLAASSNAFSRNNKLGSLLRGYLSLSAVAHALLATYLLKFHQCGGERVMHLLNTKYQPFPRQKIHIIMHAPCYSFPGYAQLLPSPSSYEIYTPSCSAPWEMESGGNINEQFDFMLSTAHGRRLPIDELYVLTFDGFYNSTNYLEHGLKVVENVTHAYFDFDLDEPRPMLRVVLYHFDYSLLE
eukprot:gene37508-45551_t